MSQVFPASLIQQIEFCEAHAPIWALAPSAVGVSSAQCTALAAATLNCRKAFNDALAARENSKAATTTMNAQAIPMRALVTDMIRSIKAYAGLQANPAIVYGLAQIPEPMQPSPLPAPGKPTNILVTLESTGAVTLSWEATDAAQSSGAFYGISRKLPGQSGFVSVGNSAGSTTRSRRMTFTDNNIPTSAAASGAQYVIQGRRADDYGTASDAITVQFGVDGGGFSVSGAGAQMKLAA